MISGFKWQVRQKNMVNLVENSHFMAPDILIHEDPKADLHTLAEDL
jgi:hypothetical protein